MDMGKKKNSHSVRGKKVKERRKKGKPFLGDGTERKEGVVLWPWGWLCPHLGSELSEFPILDLGEIEAMRNYPQ